MDDSEVQLKDIDLDESSNKPQFSFSENPVNSSVSVAGFMPEDFSKHPIMLKFYEDHEPVLKRHYRKMVCCSSILLGFYIFISLILAAFVMQRPRREGAVHFVYLFYVGFSTLQELLSAFSYITLYDQYDRDFLVARNQVSAEQRGEGLVPVEAFGLEASTWMLTVNWAWGQLERLTVYLNFVFVYRTFSSTNDIGLQATSVIFYIIVLCAFSCFFPICGARLKPKIYAEKLQILCACTMQHGLGYISKLVAVKSQRMYAKSESSSLILPQESRPIIALVYWVGLFLGFFCLTIYFLAVYQVRSACVISLLSAVAVLGRRLRVSCS
jgi:hypothetical protein